MKKCRWTKCSIVDPDPIFYFDSDPDPALDPALDPVSVLKLDKF